MRAKGRGCLLSSMGRLYEDSSDSYQLLKRA
jgi:hypothetical protein